MRYASFLTPAVLMLSASLTLAGNCPDEEFYGSSTAGSGGITPVVDTGGGNAELGNTQFELQVEQGLGGANGTMFIALNQGSNFVPDFGVTLNVLPPWLTVNFRLNNPGTPGAGEFKLPAPVPNDATLVGLDIYVQAIIADPAGPKGFSATQGMHFVICSG